MIPKFAPMATGRLLPVRLASDANEGCALGCLLDFALLWNGITWAVGFGILLGTPGGRVESLPMVILSAFALLGAGMIVTLVRRAMVFAVVGPTVIEIDTHPLRPEADGELAVTQSGRLTMNALVVALVCQERATYRQGTTTRTESRTAYEAELLRAEVFEIDEGEPFMARARFRIPPEAMHSFEATHNKIAWNHVVRGDVASWPDFERAFPILVEPAPGGMSP